MNLIRLYLFGSFRLERDSKPIHLATHKVESLLAYLALFPEQHPREKLAALLWGDATDEQARHSLRTALVAIRKKLGEEILLADRESIQLNPDLPLWVDAREFEQMANSKSQMANADSAISHYANLLPDFYDDWIIRERERLSVLYVNALLQLTQHYRSASDYARAIETAQKILATERANEKAHQHLMFCFAAHGDRIAALKQYDECQKILREDLNAEPSSETTALRDQIMQELTGAPSREAAMTNLPNPLTSFVGREKELGELRELLGKARLLTLSGSGGCGKTRLAIELASHLARGDDSPNRLYKNGVWWVDLSALSEPSLVPQTVAAVFDLREIPNTPLLKLLTNFLREKELLLLLDNCEHLIDPCARLAETLLSASLKLQILTTSREALNVTGETVWHVPSLAVPDDKHLPPLDQLTQYDAIKLFVQRAAAIAPNWKLNGNARAVAQICARLDGIPLAIELAAARLKTLSAEQIAERLNDRFQLLTGGSRTAMARQQTLRATIDWSYDLLSEQERALLRRLSVFVGGWTLEAAEAICSGDGIEKRDVIDLLTKLLDKSLAIVEERDRLPRYRLPETIRQYSREKLMESGESVKGWKRHLEYFLKLAEEAEPQLQRTKQKEWSDRLEMEHDNLRTAFNWAIENDIDSALRLAWSIRLFWVMGGHLIEGQDWATRLIQRIDRLQSTASRARAFNIASFVAIRRRDFQSARMLSERGLETARSSRSKQEIAFALNQVAVSLHFLGESKAGRPFFEESLEIYRELDDKWAIAFVLVGCASEAKERGDYELAQSFLEESTANLRKIGDQYSMRSVLNILGELARGKGDFQSASAFYKEAIEADRVINNKTTHVVALGNWAWVTLRLGDLELAKKLNQQTLTLSQEQGNLDNLTQCLAGLAGIIGAKGYPEQAASLLGAVEAARQAYGVPMQTTDRIDYEHTVASVRAQLDETTFAKAWTEGRAMTMEQAIEYALENVKSKS